MIKMDTIFMNSENSKTSKSHVLTLRLTNKLDIRLDRFESTRFESIIYICP